ncbi:MAG TPA: UDP-N-acetylglucosamine-1-phosphate transferase [Methanomicrobiales archaeon]|nr:UDP-N-acetylglucosamine-1-phosphate transferase [Methanomicrobiales archaeon]
MASTVDPAALVLALVVPLVLTAAIMPYCIRRMKERGIVARDMYKRDTPDVAINGGLVILLVALFSVSILSLIYAQYISAENHVMISVVVLFAFFGLVDDYIDIGRVPKILLLYYCSYPLIPYVSVVPLQVPFLGMVDLNIYLQFIIPIFVPVVANLVNMHSGFNGLAPGLSLIILSTLVLKAWFFGDISKIIFILCLTGALAGYFFFEYYPARIFWGNVGALAVGAAIGATCVVEGFIVSGFVMLIPHTVNFLMWIYWNLNMKRMPFRKFGRIREDGTIEVPNRLTLKWVLPASFRMTEVQATLAMFGLTGIFCIAGFFIPG